jgi:Ca-activated chloride channel family protein
VLEFGLPLAFALLPAPLLVRWLLPPHRQRVPAIRVPFFAMLVEAAGAEAREGAVVLRRSRGQMVLASLAWVLVVVGLAEPTWVGAPVERTEASRDVMLAVDLSGSMDTVDFRASGGEREQRLAVVKRVIDGFVAAREHDRIGLVVFGDRAFLQLPFTRDLDAARDLVDLMAVGMAGPRTALGDAIGLAIRTFESSEVEQRVLVLLSDGSDTASSMTPVNAAEIARLHGVEVHTIGVGDPEARGEARVDFAALSAIAERTGGQFFTADDEVGLAAVYARIDALAPAEVRTSTWKPRTALTHWPAGALVLLGILGFGLLGPDRGRRAA